MMKLVLFDIDGTLCEPMDTIPDSTRAALQSLKDAGFHVGVVGGSDRQKAFKQLGEEVIDKILDHAFHENGCVYYRKGFLVGQDHLEDFICPEELLDLTSFLLGAVADSGSPIMTGTFVERRSSMINCSPCGRACTPAQRQSFWEWDKESKCRETIVAGIKKRFGHLPLEIAVGGMISIDIYPQGLNKTRCLRYVQDTYDEIHFVGDRVDKGGNDYELYSDERVIGHRTTGFRETEKIIEGLISRYHDTKR